MLLVLFRSFVRILLFIFFTSFSGSLFHMVVSIASPEKKELYQLNPLLLFLVVLQFLSLVKKSKERGEHPVIDDVNTVNLKHNGKTDLEI